MAPEGAVQHRSIAQGMHLQNGHIVQLFGAGFECIEQGDRLTIGDGHHQFGARCDAVHDVGRAGHSFGADELGNGHESKPSPKRSSDRSQRLRFPVWSSRSSDQRVVWMPMNRNGSGGKGSGFSCTNLV